MNSVMHVFRLHGRGGQGIDTARKILGRAAFLSGFYVQDFTLHPAEWRTQPTVAYVKASRDAFTSRDLTLPDFVLVFEHGLAATALNDVKEGAIAIFNAGEKLPKSISRKAKSYYVPATDIALNHLKAAYPNTPMLGALCKAFPKLSLRSIKHAAEIELKELQHENAAAVDEGFRSLKRC